MHSKADAPVSAEEKMRDLYLRQKELLATLLEHGAISQAQHDKSLRDLTAKMKIDPDKDPSKRLACKAKTNI